MSDYLLLLSKGAWVTIQISIVSLLISVVLGMMMATFSLSRRNWLKSTAKLYTTVVRGIPSLVMMFLVYYGFQNLLNQLMYSLNLRDLFIIDSFFAGVVTIGFIYGAYMSETFRGAILAMNPGDIEAAESFGFGRMHLFFRIKLPQIIRHGYASFENNWLVLLKDTSIISIIGISDIVYHAKNAGTTTRHPFTFLFAVSIFYLLFNQFSSLGLKKIRSRFHLE